MSIENELRRAASALGTPKIVVVGDLMLDCYSWCEVERISPEAPIPVLDIRREDSFPGGASNVAMKCVELGCPAAIAGVIGNDSAGDDLIARLKAAGVDTRAVVRVNGRPTTNKHRYIARTQQVIRADKEVRNQIDTDTRIELMARIAEVAGDASAFAISDYNKGVMSAALVGDIVALARGRKIPVVVDPKGNDFSRYTGADILTPNTREAYKACAMEGPDDEKSLRPIAKRVMASTQSPYLVITRAEKGMIVYSASGGERSFPARSREVFDVTGAGDVVTAMFAVAMGSGLTPFDAAPLAITAAGIKVGQIGVGHIHRADLMTVVYGGLVSSSEKVVGLERLQLDLANLRSAGKKIVFTNGCFDIIHAGHVKLLERAREYGDVLVVGMNSDASVRRLKGQGRPVVGENARATVLASISSVDYVTLFEQDTPLELINALKPDVLVKGGDYSADDIVGSREVRALGGKVHIVPLVEGFSTTGIVEKMNSDKGRD